MKKLRYIPLVLLALSYLILIAVFVSWDSSNYDSSWFTCFMLFGVSLFQLVLSLVGIIVSPKILIRLFFVAQIPVSIFLSWFSNNFAFWQG